MYGNTGTYTQKKANKLGYKSLINMYCFDSQPGVLRFRFNIVKLIKQKS